MAASIANWIPIEWDADILVRVAQRSAVEARGKSYSMGSDTKRVLRSLDFVVGTGPTYTGDTSTNDYVLLDAVKFTGQFIVDEDALSDADSVVNTLRVKSGDFATSYAVKFDNACLAVTAASNGTTVPFTSVYKAIRTTDSGVSYTADDNYTASATGGVVSYDNLSAVVAQVEDGMYWNPANSLVIAHPGFRQVFRGIKDTQNMPVFVQGVAGTPDTLFGIEVFWSLGARTSATASGTPSGNQLLVVVGDVDALMRGDRMGPEALIDVARAHDSTDETALKLRVRKAFSLAHPGAAAVLERLA